jgi:hypothetical protein
MYILMLLSLALHIKLPYVSILYLSIDQLINWSYISLFFIFSINYHNGLVHHNKPYYTISTYMILNKTKTTRHKQDQQNQKRKQTEREKLRERERAARVNDDGGDAVVFRIELLAVKRISFFLHVSICYFLFYFLLFWFFYGWK